MPVYIEVPKPPVPEQPMEECIPVTPILPGTGFCYPPPPPLPLQWACPPVECMPFDCAPVEFGQPTVPVPASMPFPGSVLPAYDESSDVWCESSQSPFVPEAVAGASTSPVLPTYPTQPSWGKVPYPQVPIFDSQQAVQPAYETKSEDCGCGQTELGTYGPDKTNYSPFPNQRMKFSTISTSK